MVGPRPAYQAVLEAETGFQVQGQSCLKMLVVDFFFFFKLPCYCVCVHLRVYGGQRTVLKVGASFHCGLTGQELLPAEPSHQLLLI